MRSSFFEAFRVNGRVGSRAWAGLVVAQAGLVAVLWARSGWELLPGPVQLIDALVRLWTRDGLGSALVSSWRASAEALALATAFSALLAYGSLVPVLRPVAVAVSKGRFLGLGGLSFFFLLAFGGGHGLKVSLLVAGMTVFLVTGLLAELEAIPQERFDHARSLGLGPVRTSWEVAVLGTADRALDLVRQNAAIGWTMLTLVEGLTRSEGGVGALLLNHSRHLHLAEVLALQGVVLAVGLVQDGLLGLLREWCCPYAARSSA